MKKILVISCLLCFGIAFQATSQNGLSLNVYGNYTFNDRVKFDAAYTDIQGAFEYGGGLEFFTHPTKSIELKYLRMDTRFPLYSANGTKLNEGSDKGALNFVLIGGNNYFSRGSNSKTTPFAGFDLGVGWLTGEGEATDIKFSWDAKLGVKVKTSSSLSLKLHAYVQSMISSFGTDYFVTAGGAVIAGPDYAHIFQFGLGGAICFDFKK